MISSQIVLPIIYEMYDDQFIYFVQKLKSKNKIKYGLFNIFLES